MDEALAVSAGEVVPYKILPAVVRKVSEVVERRLQLFNFRYEMPNSPVDVGSLSAMC